ncbi:uncharacterized protein FIBRA_00124 [Fibroporia radiculosa]|uniref:Uncharacterized protein n=1 Tax=Fibroporia radiculosa TaxID=599839 RepID=J7RUX8_9APHY|nr:uncharacterized protein FIBRA_00124 [Fibroporia radiculosa]CCL98130.1 predicted protein [Fibroporia radiculosa]
MLPRSLSTVHSLRAISARLKVRHLAPHRPNSSIAGDVVLTQDASLVDAVATQKRSIPMADIYADIVIPIHKPRGPARSNQRTEGPNLSWLAHDEFDPGNGLAGRLARRSQASDGEPKTHSPPSRKNGRPMVSANGNSHVTAVEESRANREGSSRGGTQVSDRRSMRQADGAERGQRQRQNRDQRQVSQKRQLRDRRSQTQGQKKSPSSTDVDPQKNMTEESSVSPAPLPMHIHTTDLSKLFGPTDTLTSSSLTPAPSYRPTSVSAHSRRIQSILDGSGGDYSRYLPADLGTTFPESLGALGYARLTLARRRELGLRSRGIGLGIVQRMVIQKVVNVDMKVASTLSA